MEKNIFEGVKFGDKFVTREGKQAIYIASKETTHALIVDSRESTLLFDNDGVQIQGWSEFDIVSRYQEKTSDEPTYTLSKASKFDRSCRMRLSEFRSCVESGCIMDDDGCGYYGTKDMVSDIDCFNAIVPEEMKYVYWYNK